MVAVDSESIINRFGCVLILSGSLLFLLQRSCSRLIPQTPFFYSTPSYATALRNVSLLVNSSSIEFPPAGWPVADEWRLPNKGIYQSTSYLERYNLYRKPLTIKKRRRSTTLFTIRAQPKHFAHPILEDVVLRLRSSIYEIQECAGLDVVVLVDRDDEQQNADWLNSVPADILPFVQEVTQSEIIDHFPSAVGHGAGLHSASFWTVYLWSYDQQENNRYQFFWTCEIDVRLLGGDWVQLFHNVNQSLSPSPNVDLLSLGPFWKPPLDTPDELQCLGAFVDPENLYRTMMHLIGISRRYKEILVKLLKTGKGCEDEDFMASAAYQYGLVHEQVHHAIIGENIKTSYVPPQFDTAQQIYETWRTTNGLMPGPMLLHAYKAEKGLQAHIDLVEGFTRGGPI